MVRIFCRLWYYCGQTKNHRRIGGDFSRNGGPEGIRTLDLSDANRTLSQLSYGPVYEVFGDVNCLPATELDYRKRGAITEPLLLPTELQAHELFSPHIIPQLFSFVKSFFHFFQKIFVAFPKTVSYNIFCYPSSAYSCGIGLAQ